MIWYIYIVSIAYCIWRMSVSYKHHFGNSPIGPTPGLETLFILPFAPVLAVVDASLTWIRLVKEAEEAKRRQQSKIF
jgi:hypothetical protein